MRHTVDVRDPKNRISIRYRPTHVPISTLHASGIALSLSISFLSLLI